MKESEKSRWKHYDMSKVKAGDIIVNGREQTNPLVVLRVDDSAIWVIGLVHCSFCENMERHPIFPLYRDEIVEILVEPMVLGNLTDYTEFIERIQTEIDESIKGIDGYFEAGNDTSK